jgi:hypothetical protein
MRITVHGYGWAAGLVVGLAAWACSGSLPHPPYVPQPSSALTAIPIEPPPARVEAVPASPARGAVWVDGEWTYRRGRWAWVLGRWVIPAPDTAFSPWTVVRSADGDLLQAPGVWRDKQGNPIDPPAPLKMAEAQAGSVVDPEGVTEQTGRTLTAIPKPVAVTDGGAEDAAMSVGDREPAPARAPRPRRHFSRAKSQGLCSIHQSDLGRIAA